MKLPIKRTLLFIALDAQYKSDTNVLEIRPGKLIREATASEENTVQLNYKISGTTEDEPSVNSILLG
jgi:hypothetical protein